MTPASADLPKRADLAKGADLPVPKGADLPLPKGADLSKRADLAKRAFDVCVAVVLFLLTLPIQLATAMAVRIRLGRPVFFRHTRPGLHGKPFEIIKFRTFLNEDPALGRIDDASRMTPFGLWLRGTSLDELPTLWNVIRGDLSLVGPRPLLMSYLELYSPEQARRHEVRPGVTGLAQSSGRNALTWDETFRLDVHYVDHHTFIGDLVILCRTASSVARRDGIAEDGEVTSSLFLGNDQIVDNDLVGGDLVGNDLVGGDLVGGDEFRCNEKLLENDQHEGGPGKLEGA